MKKQLWSIFLVVLFLLLTGCQRVDQPQESQTQGSSSLPSEPAPEDGNTPSSEEAKAVDSQKEPLQLGEGIVSEGSFSDMEERFGPCEDYEVSYEGPGTGMFELNLEYQKMQICLYLDLPSSRTMDEEQLYNKDSLRDYTLTEEDKNEKGWVRSIHWSDPNVKGPRGTMIGDSPKEVKAKFLDLSEKYNDGETIYKLSDVDPSYPSELPEYSVSESGAKMGSMSGVAGEYISYCANVPPDQEDSDYWHTYEYTTFYLTDGKVSSIDQGYFSELDRP